MASLKRNFLQYLSTDVSENVLEYANMILDEVFKAKSDSISAMLLIIKKWEGSKIFQAAGSVLTLARVPNFATFARVGGGRPPWRFETKRRRA